MTALGRWIEVVQRPYEMTPPPVPRPMPRPGLTGAKLLLGGAVIAGLAWLLSGDEDKKNDTEE